MAFIINAQSGCNVFITSSFDSKCVLTNEKEDILVENGEAMLACKGSTVTYTASSPDAALYNWTITGQSSYSANGNTVTVNWSYGNVGKVTVQITTSNGEICEATKDITLIEKPQIGSSTIPNYRLENGTKIIEICLGETIYFTNESTTTNTDISGHYWESEYSKASTENYTIENIMQGITVFHTIINNCGCEDREAYKIIVLEGKKLELTCYGTVCEGAEVTYEVKNGNCSEYNWFVEGGHIKYGQNSPKITIQWGNPDCGYGVLGLDGGPCDDFCKKLMSVKIPIITNNAKITGQEIACVDEVALYSSTLWGSTEYTWTITPSQGISQSHYDNANQTLLTFTSPGTYQLNVTYKCDFLDCGPFVSQTKTIVVKPKLKIDSENEKICLGQTSIFTINDNSITATWKVYNANNQQVYTSQTNSLIFSPTLSGKYRVTAEHVNYCNVAEFLLNVKDPPPAPTGATISGKNNTCPNTSILLTGTPESAFYSLVWKSLCSNPTIEGTGNEFTASYPGNGCNIEVYHYDKEVGCLSTTPYIYQIQDFILAPTTLPTSVITVCAESIIEYMIDEVPNQSPDVIYEWKISPENAATILGDKTKNNVRVLVNTSGVSLFDIILERKYCTDILSSTTIPVSIVSPPSAPTISPSPIPSVCVNTEVTLSTGTINSDGYSWSIDNGSKIYNNLQTIGHTFTTAGTHNIQLSYQPYSVCPAAVTNTTINVIASPKFTLHDDNNGNVSVTPYDGANYTNYAWTQNGVSVNNTTGTFIGAQLNDEICCTVTNSAGCSETKCIRLIQQPGQNNPPCLPFNAISVNNICSDQSIRVIATNNPTVNPVKWTVLPNDTYTINSIDNNESKITFNSTGSYTVKGFVSDGSNCYKSNTLYIEVPVILDFDVEYNCSSPIGLKITDNSQYSVIQNRTFTITGGVAPVTMLPSERVKTQYVPLPTSGSVTYNVTLSISGCIMTKSITLYPRITSASIIAPYSNNACQDVPLLLTVNSIPSSTPVTYSTWNFGDGSSNSSSNTNSIYHIFQVRPQHYLVGVNITDANNCILPINPTIQITSRANSLSSGLLNRPGNLVCPGVQRDINYTPELTASTYLWHLTPPTNNISNYSTYKTGDYYVRVTSDIGCIGEAMINVPFKNKPTAFISGKTEYCQNDKVELFGDIGSNSSSLTYTWDITTPTTTLPQETTPNITFTASQIGTYIVDLTVYNDECSDTYTHTFTVNATPLAPNINFAGNQCIDQPPVVLAATAPNGESIYWSSGVKSPTANYYSSGYALAYYYDQISGCKSQDGQILIASAPNFDALLTGCYKKCKYLLPSYLNVYNLSKDDISWKWFFNTNSINGNGNYLFSPLSLPLSGFGTYNLDVNYNSNICNVVSPSLVIEEESCPCAKVEIKVVAKQYVEECRIIYRAEVDICNNGDNEACYDNIISGTQGVNILNTENFPLSIPSGNCQKFILYFEILNTLSNEATFTLYDACNECYKEFTVNTNIEILDCDKEILIEGIFYHPEISSENVSYFNFSLNLTSNPQAIFGVWSEPSQIINFNFNPNNGSIDGLSMFDRNLLIQMAERDEKICFYVWMCYNDEIHQCHVCISARELLENSGGAKSKPITPTDNDNQTSQSDKLYLVPNPASTYVRVEGIEQDNISELLLIDMTGKNLKKVQSTNTLDIQDVLKGTYILRVINKENKVYYLKLIKN